LWGSKMQVCENCSQPLTPGRHRLINTSGELIFFTQRTQREILCSVKYNAEQQHHLHFPPRSLRKKIFLPVFTQRAQREMLRSVKYNAE
jgi:hypothetical protein